MNIRSTTNNRSFPWNVVTVFRPTIHVKLVLTLLIAAIVPLVLMHTAWRRSASDTLARQATKRCEVLRDVKANQLSRFFEDVRDRIRLVSSNEVVVSAMRELTGALSSARGENDVTQDDAPRLRAAVSSFYAREFADIYGERNSGKPLVVDDCLLDMDDDSIYLQYLYVLENPHPLGSTELLERANDNSNYSLLHAKYHSRIRKFLDDSGCSNILLSDTTGRIVYSVRKTLDFATSLTSKSRANTNLGSIFRDAVEANLPNDVLFSDFSNHLACYDDVTGFAISPILNGPNRIGFVILQIPIDPINRIATKLYAPTNTGETYLVGPDKLFRTDSRFLDQLQIATTIRNKNFVVDTAAVEMALAGNSGSGVIPGYKGISVLSSWRPFVIPTTGNRQSDPVTWALLSEISLNESQSPARGFQAASNAAVPTVVSLVVALGIAFLLARGWTAQAASILRTLNQSSIGKKEERADFICNDEFGDVANSLNDWLREVSDRTLSCETADARKSPCSITEAAEMAPSGTTGSSTDDSAEYADEQLRQFISEVQDVTLHVSGFAQQIRSATENLSAESSAQVSQVVDTSLAVDEMVESIGHVAESSAQSATVAEEARLTTSKGSQAVLDTIKGMERIRSQVQSTSKRIKRLGESSQEIGEIVQLISDVADRTSILALNASVQAAMAGDAGHGFGVVAEEVERLSKRCNEATKHIARLVKSIQSETSEAIVGMEESTVEVVEGSKLASQAGESLADIDSVFNRLAELIDSMSFAAKQHARGGLLVSRSIKEVSSVMDNTASGTKQAAELVNQLTACVDNLRSSIDRFTMPRMIPNGGSHASSPGHAPSIMPVVGISPLNTAPLTDVTAAVQFTDVKTAT